MSSFTTEIIADVEASLANAKPINAVINELAVENKELIDKARKELTDEIRTMANHFIERLRVHFRNINREALNWE